MKIFLSLTFIATLKFSKNRLQFELNCRQNSFTHVPGMKQAARKPRFLHTQFKNCLKVGFASLCELSVQIIQRRQ